MFQEILNDFPDEFFSLHSRRCRERLLVLVTQCVAHAMGEKKYLRFFAVFFFFLFSYFYCSLFSRFAKSNSTQYGKRAVTAQFITL